MVIFHCHVSSPEGNLCYFSHGFPQGIPAAHLLRSALLGPRRADRGPGNCAHGAPAWSGIGFSGVYRFDMGFIGIYGELIGIYRDL